ncbi:Protein MKS1 [Platanthera guangdongensis]|uniref:Protein MKS1 n=1 Tax=Platanthera guangdongensis TaxID=2320717 RepID=A0ABR2M2V5_9ASPA
MESSYPLPQQNSPRRELQLQGPRPTPLRVNKDSHKIRKPPLPPPRDPVIIYTISPKVIHVELDDFMGLVQRLTGTSTDAANQALSPAAKLATIQSASGLGRSIDLPLDLDLGQLEMDRSTTNPGILSPVPSSLPPVSPGFFSPSYLDPSFLGFLHDLSPAGLLDRRSSPSSASIAAAAAETFTSGSSGGRSFFVSPGKFLSSPLIPSPGSAFWDLFNHLKDF